MRKMHLVLDQILAAVPEVATGNKSLEFLSGIHFFIYSLYLFGSPL